MPLRGISLSSSNLQFGGDGDWDLNQGSQPIVGTFSGSGNTQIPLSVTLTSSTGTSFSFVQTFSQNLSQSSAFTVNLTPAAQDFMNGLPPGATVDVGASSGTFSSTLDDLPITCVAAGTLIATARGEVPVEALRVGDLVVTAHGGAPLQPVVWLGHTRVHVAKQRDRAKAAPILIRAGALADGAPHRDLRVSPEHAMFLDGRLVPAKHLVNGTSIIQELWCPEVTYWHVELPAHGLLVAEGAMSESYFNDGNRKHFDNYGITTLFKDFESERGNGRYAEQACYPLLTEGAPLDRIRARLDARAAVPKDGTAQRRSA